LIETKRLQLNYGEKVIIDSLDLIIPKGEITVLIGANGCGKSTLLRSIARLLKPNSGSILLNNENITRFTTKETAKHLAILPQQPMAPEGLTVLQLVKQGRFPYQNWRKQWSTEDQQVVEQAIAATGLTEFKDYEIDNLSGGQRQRAWIAMTLAQQTDLILLDEPTTYLDVTHQIEVLDLLYKLNQEENRTIVMVLHDINLACRYATNIIALVNKELYAQGRPEDIITVKLVKDVFQLNCKIIEDPIYGTPMCIPYGNKNEPRQ